MSVVTSRSPAARFVACDWNATQCGELETEPSTDGLNESLSACLPLLDTLTRSREPEPRGSVSLLRPVGRDHRKMSRLPFESPPTRFDASE